MSTQRLRHKLEGSTTFPTDWHQTDLRPIRLTCNQRINTFSNILILVFLCRTSQSSPATKSELQLSLTNMSLDFVTHASYTSYPARFEVCTSLRAITDDVSFVSILDFHCAEQRPFSLRQRLRTTFPCRALHQHHSDQSKLCRTPITAVAHHDPLDTGPSFRILHNI